MKILYAIVVIMFLLFIGMGTGLVGITYPIVIEDQPFTNPCKVQKVVEHEMFLEDGRIVVLDRPEGIKEILAYSKHTIELHEDENNSVLIVARRNGWVCGTPWAKLIRIPIIGEKVYKNKLEPFSHGWLIPKEKIESREREDREEL